MSTDRKDRIHFDCRIYVLDKHSFGVENISSKVIIQPLAFIYIEYSNIWDYWYQKFFLIWSIENLG